MNSPIRLPKKITTGRDCMAKKLTTLYLDVELIERLNKLSLETRVPKAVYIRDAIDLVLNKYEKELLEGQA